MLIWVKIQVHSKCHVRDEIESDSFSSSSAHDLLVAIFNVIIAVFP